MASEQDGNLWVPQVDKNHIWHPYTAMPSSQKNHEVLSANGVYLNLADGRRVIDAMSSWWCIIHGYNHPVLNRAIKSQLDKMAHVMFGGLTHEPAAALAQTLVNITPEGLNQVFFADSGSVSVEVAIKMALQYWQSQGQSGKHRLLSLKGGYHGDTFGAMSVCDPVNGMHHLFQHNLMPQVFTGVPSCSFSAPWKVHYIDDFEHQIRTHAQELAAVILEPVVQGAGGMRFYSPSYLHEVRKLCDEHNVLLIADEIATGFGRTGKLFACEWADISPDILCVGKALTGGYMTLAATLCTNNVSQGICRGEAGVFMHGPTFMANPLACAVANASIDLLLNQPWQQKIHRIETQLTEGLAPLSGHPSVADVRILGAIGVVEMKEAVNITHFQDQCLNAGVWVRPFGKLVYTMPPFCITPAELTVVTDAIKNTITAR